MKPPTDITIARNMLENRDKGFTFGLFYRRNLRNYIVKFIIQSAAIGVVAYLEVWPIVWLLAGLVIGSFSRDIGWVRSIRRRWPLSVALTDWEKVRQLAEGKPLPPAL